MTPRTSRVQAMVLLASLSFIAVPSAVADIKSWGVGDGFWNTASNWSPVGVPLPADFVLIGNTVAAQNEWVTMNVNSVISSLTVTDGMAVDTDGALLVVTGTTTLSGSNSDGQQIYPSRIIVDDGMQAVDYVTQDLTMSDGASLQIQGGAVVQVNGVMTLNDPSSCSGHGTLNLTGDQPVVLLKNGFLSAAVEGLTVNQLGEGLIDLDGTSIGDILNITLSRIDGSAFAWMTFNGDALADPMGDEIWVSENNVLTMNFSAGWAVDSVSEISFFNNISFPAPGEINGTALDLSANLDLFTGAHGQFNCPVTLQAPIFADLSPNARLEFTAATILNGGDYVLEEGANVDFAGPTTVQGGTFATFSSSASDGTIDFLGSTTWNGDIVVDGVARQIGDASVTGPSQIDAGVFDFGLLNNWSIGNGLVVNAGAIGSLFAGSSFADFSIAGTFLGKLTVNLTDPNAEWNQLGDLNLGGVAAIMTTRIAGSRIRINGDANITNRVQITADAILDAGSEVNFASATARLQLAGTSLVDDGCAFTGGGLLANAASGDMTLAQGTNLGASSLSNAGTLRLGSSPGLVFTQGFSSERTATWVVELGGSAPGFEHDQLVVTGTQVSLGGVLDARLIDLGGGFFQPGLGDEFLILTSASAVPTGSFSNQPVSFIPGKAYIWTVNYLTDGVSLEVADIVPCPADLDGDGKVDGADLGILLSEWGACGGCIADITLDGVVDGADLGYLLSNWGPCL